jgi:preprotein translocase subunit SecE
MLKKNTNDIILWCTIIVLIFSSFSSFYYFSNYLMITRIFLLIITFLISCLLFTKTYLGKFCWISIRESFKEIYLITWPTTKETFQTALLISGIVIFMGLILCLIDVIFFNIIKWVANFG